MFDNNAFSCAAASPAASAIHSYPTEHIQHPASHATSTSVSASSASSRTSGKTSLGECSHGRNMRPPASGSLLPSPAADCLGGVRRVPSSPCSSARLCCRVHRRRPEPTSSADTIRNPQVFRDLGDGFGPFTGQATARRRNSGGWGAGTATSFPVAGATSGRVSGLRGEAQGSIWSGTPMDTEASAVSTNVHRVLRAPRRRLAALPPIANTPVWASGGALRGAAWITRPTRQRSWTPH